ncbi:MAG: pilin [Patescibacteria group bacterium]
MKRILPLLLLGFLISAPLSVSAQCAVGSQSTCSTNDVCASVNGQPKCIAAQCAQFCKTNQTCLSACGTSASAGSGGQGSVPGSGGTGTIPGSGGTGTIPGSGGQGSVSPGLTNPLNSIDSLPQLLAAVLAAIVRIGTIILTLALVYVGFLFVAAQGNEEKISNAKSALLWTVIGGLILLGASAIGAVIGSTVGKL